MNTNNTLATVLAGFGLLATACQGPKAIELDAASSARTLEVTLDGDGHPMEIEYHIDPMMVPEAVRNAMDELHPGGPFTDAERERNDGQLYYELNRLVDGREVEAMFSPEGALHSEEIEVGAHEVPEAVIVAVKERFPEGRVTKYEEIRNGQRELVEYHVKVLADGKKHKVTLSLAGSIHQVYIELPSEIEIPIGS